jgi:ABC-2 type transport system permease protein
MRKYLEVAKILFKAQLSYRFHIVFDIFFTITKIMFAYIIWGVIFEKESLISGFTIHTMLTYYIVSSFLSQLEMSEGVSGEISYRIRDGSFSKYMVVPVGTQGYFIAQTFGAAAYNIFFIFTATALWVLLFRIKLVLTADLAVISSTALMVLLGMIFMIQFNYFLGILAFKFQDVSLFLMIKGNLVAFFTGTLVPLVLLPEALTYAMKFFPFYYVTYLPSMLLIGRSGNEIIPGLLTLSIWIILFIPVNGVFYNSLRKKYDGVGI